MAFPRLLFLVSVCAIGCGGSTNGDSGSGGTGTGGTSTGGTSTGGTSTGGTGTGGAATGGSAGSAGTGSCTTDADCEKGICGYPTSDGCSAKGQCFPDPAPMCNGYAPGCACDGTQISLICEGLPDGYTKKPLAHAGACEVLDAGGPFACGDGLTCNSSTEFCKIGMGGPCCAPPSYSCEAIPAKCQSDHSCSCIQDAVGGQLCSETGGGVTVTFQYP